MCIIFTVIIFSVRDDVLVDSETFLVIDFINLKIKPAQYFRCAHKSMVCMRIFIGVSVFVLCFLKKDDKAEKYNTIIPALDCHPDLLNLISSFLFRGALTGFGSGPQSCYSSWLCLMLHLF
jgi:hypothetical protein